MAVDWVNISISITTPIILIVIAYVFNKKFQSFKSDLDLAERHREYAHRIKIDYYEKKLKTFNL